MRKIDYHMHTYFSADSEADPKVHIHTAIAKGLDEICFTDHRDFHYPECPFELDADNYFKELKQLQRQFQQLIKIKIGLEIGLAQSMLFIKLNFMNQQLSLLIKQKRKLIESSF